MWIRTHGKINSLISPLFQWWSWILEQPFYLVDYSVSWIMHFTYVNHDDDDVNDLSEVSFIQHVYVLLCVWCRRYIRSISIGVCNSCCVGASPWRCIYGNHRNNDDYIRIRRTWISIDILYDWKYPVGAIDSGIHFYDTRRFLPLLHIGKIGAKDEFFTTPAATIDKRARLSGSAE